MSCRQLCHPRARLCGPSQVVFRINSGDSSRLLRSLTVHAGWLAYSLKGQRGLMPVSAIGRRQVVEFRTVIAAPAEEVFRWHWQPGAVHRLMPPWESVEVVTPADGPRDGATAALKVRLGPLKLHWIARHCQTIPGLQFADVQQSGPFAFWHHVHRLEPLGADRCELVDKIEYELPASPASQLIVGDYVKKRLARMFDHRHQVTAADVALFMNRGGRAMRILVTGSHGLIGSELVPFLTSLGHEVVRLVRAHPEQKDILWRPDSGVMDKSALEGLDAVVHLAGDNIASGRWTANKKAKIRSSRVLGTKLLCDTLASLKKPPAVLVSASAIGYYGHRADEVLTEESLPGAGFLADVCREWEAAVEPARRAGIRVANLRTGVVLSRRGGALSRMLPAFQMGAGGNIGSGQQWMSWVSCEDVVGAIHHIVTHPELAGPINAVAPQAVTNSRFTAVLGGVLHRPTVLSVPEFAAHLLLGEMADNLLLASALVTPRKLLDSGYTFRHAALEPMLRGLLGAA